MKQMLKEALCLILITLFAGAALGGMNELTKDKIAEQNEIKKTKSCYEVFPEASSFTEICISIDNDTNSYLEESKITPGIVYTASASDGSTLGYVIDTTSSSGYNGNIRIFTGIDLEGNIRGISFVTLNESPGLGDQAPFLLAPQFKRPATIFTVTKTGAQTSSEIDAMSGATVTSKAVTAAVNGAVKIFNLLEGGSNNE